MGPDAGIDEEEPEMARGDKESSYEVNEHCMHRLFFIPTWSIVFNIFNCPLSAHSPLPLCYLVHLYGLFQYETIKRSKAAPKVTA